MIQKIIATFYLLLLVSPAMAFDKFAEDLYKAHQESTPLPLISLKKPKTTAKMAYNVQQNYVKLRQSQDSVAGYKAGLTSTAGQKKFKVSQALSGVLFSSGHVELSSGTNQPPTVSLTKSGKLMLETEIGFILAKPITHEIKDIKQLNQSIQSVVPVIELPSLNYSNPSKLQGIDLIASNVASNQFIIGTKQDPQSINNINGITTLLKHNDKLQFEGKATDALGDQWKALQWLINQLVNQGYQLSKGDLLITGALGKMIPAQKGNYHAEFGTLGQIKFQITE